MSLLSNRKSLLIAMVAASFVFVMFGYITLKPEKQAKTTPYNYVVAKTEIKKGAVIKDEDIGIKNFPINIQGTYTATGEVVGRKASADILPGKPVMVNFIEKTTVKATVDNTPRKGFRTVPVLITTDVVPKDINADMRFDFITSDDSMRIDNLRILDVVNAQSGRNSKIVLLEIKDNDVQTFLDNFGKIKGINILRKNPSDYGEYKFRIGKTIVKKTSGDVVSANSSSLPPIDRFQADPLSEYGSSYGKNQVEVIVGKTKKTMEFSE